MFTFLIETSFENAFMVEFYQQISDLDFDNPLDCGGDYSGEVQGVRVLGFRAK